jgi:hypothetical protein
MGVMPTSRVLDERYAIRANRYETTQKYEVLVINIKMTRKNVQKIRKLAFICIFLNNFSEGSHLEIHFFDGLLSNNLHLLQIETYNSSFTG